MDKGLNVVPILYILIPITMGLIMGFIFIKYTIFNKIYPIITSLVLSVVYLTIIAIKTSSLGEYQLIPILFVWNTVVIYITYVMYTFVYTLFNKNRTTNS